MASYLKLALETARESFRSYLKDDGLTLAAALSFYTFLSMIPLTMILVSLLGHYLGNSEEAMTRIIDLMTETIPNLHPSFLHDLKLMVNRKISSGWIGIVSLFFVASLFFTSLEKILDKVFQAISSRNFFHSRLLSIGLIFSSSLFLFIPAILKTLEDILHQFHIPISFNFLMTGNLFFFLTGAFIFVLLISWVPSHRIDLRYNLSGGIVFAFLLLVAKSLFHGYIYLNFKQVSFVYGSLSTLVLIILWIFYFNNLFILCAELVGVMQKRKELSQSVKF